MVKELHGERTTHRGDYTEKGLYRRNYIEKGLHDMETTPRKDYTERDYTERDYTDRRLDGEDYTSTCIWGGDDKRDYTEDYTKKGLHGEKSTQKGD